MKFSLLLLFLLYVKLGSSKMYSNYTLFRCVPLSDSELTFLQNLTQDFTVDYWRPPGTIYNPVEFLIAPEEREKFIKEMESRQFYYTTIIPDVQSEFDSQTVKTYVRRKMDSFDWKSYFRLEDIYNWIKDLARSRPDEISVSSIGKTLAGREILSVKVILKGCRKRSVVIVEGGIHAREWISPAFVTYLLNEVINSQTSQDPNLKKIGLLYEWYFVPVLNPDGYEYSHTTDRMWRKNRRGGYGIDINRNFDIGFGTVGVERRNKRDETYCGEKAFSERESSAMAELIRSKQRDLEYYLAFHSYGQYIIIPYAHSKQHKDNYDVMKSILNTAKLKLKRRHGTLYTVGTAYDTVGYTTSGVSGCWTKATFRTPYVATFELPDSGKHGFALPPNQILPTCEETMEAITSILTPQTAHFTKLSGGRMKIPADVDGAPSIMSNTIVIVYSVLLIIQVSN